MCLRVFLAAVSLALLGVALPARAQQQPGPPTPQVSTRTFDIGGHVRYASNELPAELVRVDLRKFTGVIVAMAFTRSNGEFQFSGLSADEYILAVEVKGYEPVRENVEIFASSRHGVQLYLRKSDEFMPAEPGGSVSADELALPRKAREAFRRGLLTFYEKKDPLRGVKHFQEAVQEAPGYYQAHFEMGMAHISLGQLAEAEEVLRKAVALSQEKYAPALFALAGVLTSTRRVPEALGAVERGRKADPEAWQGHYELARALKELGRLEEAEAAARAARERNPQFADVHLLLANIHMGRQDLPALLEDLEGYLRVAPDGPMSVQVRQMREAVRQELARAPGRPAANAPRP